MNADAVGELHLRQFALAAKLPDFPADELELGWLIHSGFVDFYGVGTINFPPIYGLGGHLSSREGSKTHRNFHLLRELVKRDFHARFTGSALGILWAVLQPLSLVFLYWFVFTYMFRRPAGQNDHYIDFLIAGLLPWLGLNEGLMRSSTSIVDNAPMVRRLAFRSELLIIVPNASALIFESIALAFFGAFLLLRGMPLRLVWLLPFVLVVQFAVQVGVGWILAVTYVFFRDLTPILAFLLGVIFYLSPILYPVAGRFERIFMWNPMTPLLGLFRSAMLSATLPAAGSIVFLLAVATATFIGGLLFFRRAQGTLADLI
jgi:ABC-type polysaccharide/polyol phosphate export permease